MLNKIRAFLIARFVFLCVDAFGAVSDAEIDARFGATNPPSRLRAVAYPLLTNLQHQAASFAPGELRRVQYHLMTKIRGKMCYNTLEDTGPCASERG